MFEIELKAHVKNYDAVKNTLDGFSQYCGFADKRDIYFRHEYAGVTVRIRTEQFCDAREKNAQRLTHYVTYKKKELRKQAGNDSGAAAIEVNDEKEFIVSDPEPLKILLNDIGFKVKLMKHKSAHKWESGRAVIELCTVEPLGDFLEIEIICESNDESHVASARTEIEALIVRAGVSLDDLEERYYSDLLKAADL